MKITKYIEIDAGHRVPEHDGKCRHPHGHRYRFTIEVAGDVYSDGMVIDYAILKDLLIQHVDEPMDHAFLVQDTDTPVREFLEANDYKKYVMAKAPTAENLAEHAGHLLIGPLSVYGINLTAVTVNETPTSSATWTP